MAGKQPMKTWMIFARRFSGFKLPSSFFQQIENIVVTCLSEDLKDLNKADVTSKIAGRQEARHILSSKSFVILK